MGARYFFHRHPRSVFFTFILSLLLVPCSIELVLYEFLHHPSLNLYFPYLHKTVSFIYYQHELDFLQYQPQCAEYDSQLLYVMKPGECRHSSIEFDCRYSFNRMGLRDDDASLEKPEIIVLGDSYAMGWGVEDKKIFPSLLEHETGMKILNVSVSSYGTAREFMLMNRVDISNLKYLMIQYCTNDFDENKQFVDDGFNLKIQSKQYYETIVSNHINRIKYRPFLYLSTLFKVAWERFFGRNDSGDPGKKVSKAAVDNAFLTQHSAEISQPDVIRSEDSVRYFLEIVRSKPELEQVKIIVLNISGPLYTTPSFIQSLSEIKAGVSYPPFIRNMKLIDICANVKRDDYFTLDNHLNEKGHRKIADLLSAAIEAE